MRFSLKRLYLTLLLITACYVTYLGLQDQLRLYIHPRYIVFTLTMAIIALVLITSDVYFNKKGDIHHTKWLSLTPLLFMLLIAVFLPARTLTSATVSQRTTDAGSIVVTTESRAVSSLFSGSSRGLTLTDWSRLLATNNEPSYYASKPAKVSGFVYDAGLGDDHVWLARFVLTCCAVDAQPVGVPVQLSGWSSEYEEDEWLEVEGEFALAETHDGEQLVLIPTDVTKIDQPSNPYAN